MTILACPLAPILEVRIYFDPLVSQFAVESIDNPSEQSQLPLVDDATNVWVHEAGDVNLLYYFRFVRLLDVCPELRYGLLFDWFGFAETSSILIPHRYWFQYWY